MTVIGPTPAKDRKTGSYVTLVETRTASGARSAAEDGARRSLSQQDLQCTSVSVDIDTAGFAVPVGLPAQVRATVTCDVRLADLALPGFPGSRTVTATAVSPLDTYRERG